MKLEVGQVVDRYTVDALIGAGGTAMVYRVRHKQLNTWHALKVLTITSESIRQRMIREGQVQASLRHLNVVTVTDVLDLDGAPGLLMEYIDGPSLERALGQFRLTMGDAETLYQGIVAGVRQAHLFGLVHRDLKPANVLLARSREGFVPKVTDFGLAKLLENDPSVAHTRSGIAMGTPSYMAPEQIRDARTVDQRADLWSLGAILYELVTRTRAFPGDEALPIYNAVTVGDYVRPRELIPDLPDRLDQAIRGCLTVDREHRIPDCETLVAVLAGRRSWEVHGDEPAVREAVASLPPSLPSDVPEMQVAARKTDGSTPRPPPPRLGQTPAPSAAAGGLGVLAVPGSSAASSSGEADTVVLQGVGAAMDGTLDASDSLVPPEEEGGRTWVGVLLLAVSTLLFGGVGLILVLAFLGSLFVSSSREGADPTAVSPAPGPVPVAAPVEPAAPEPVSPAPEPVAGPAPEAAPKPAPAPKAAPKPAAPRPAAPRPAPAAAPAPASEEPVAAVPDVPPPPQPVQVKLLSVPPTATLMVDGQPVGRTPSKLELLPGRHAVHLQSGDQIGEYVVDVQPGSENKWCFAFDTRTNHEGSCP